MLAITPRRATLCQLAIILAATGLASEARAGGTFYVSKSGNDGNAGTLASPWLTISKAAKSLTAGSTVLIESGTYVERVVVSVSGNATAGPITFKAAPGQIVTIKGPGRPVSPDGLPVGLIDIRNQSYITVSGLNITGYTGDSNATFPAGIAVVGTANHVTISGNHVHGIVGSTSGLYGAHGIAAYGTTTAGITNLVIDGNTVDHLRTGQSESVVVNGNVSHWRITNNKIFNNDNIGIDAIGFENTLPQIGGKHNPLDQARDGVIAGNLVYNIDSNKNPSYGKLVNGSNHSDGADGIYVDGGTRIVVERNAVHNTNFGIELASEHKGTATSDVIARNNILYSNYGAAISLGGYGAGSTGSSDHVQIVNNTLFNNDTRRLGEGEIQLQYWSAAASNTFINNVIAPGSQAIILSSLTSLPVAAFNNNLYDSRYGGDLIWTWKGIDQLGFAAFRSASGQEALGFVGDPGFIDRTTLSLQPLWSSIVRDRGEKLSSSIVGLVDFNGAARVSGAGIDIGAFELAPRGSFTNALHAALSRQAANLTSFGSAASVPEPTSWALLVAGFALCGAMVRRQRAGPKTMSA